MKVPTLHMGHGYFWVAKWCFSHHVIVYVWICGEKNWFWGNWSCKIGYDYKWLGDKVVCVLIYLYKSKLNFKFVSKNQL